LHKYGWFCDSCKSTLVADNLVVIDAPDGSGTRVKLQEPAAENGNHFGCEEYQNKTFPEAIKEKLNGMT
jgi:hypothetical protein